VGTQGSVAFRFTDQLMTVKSMDGNPMQYPRIAVTGIGAVTPLGKNVAESWDNLCAGVSATQHTERYDATNFPVRISSEVKGFEPNKVFKGLPRRIYNDARRQDRTHQYALAASLEALAHAGLPLPLPEDLQFRCGVLSGNCLGGASTVEQASQRTGRGELNSIMPSDVLRIMPNAATALIAAAVSARGPNFTPSVACATGTIAMGEAMWMLHTGRADVMVACGSDGVVVPTITAVFSARGGPMSRRNDDPQHASRPADVDRDGFVIGEGGATLILEREADAKARGAPVLAYLVGYGCTNGTGGRTEPDGEGQVQTMRIALDMAGLAPSEIDAINPHMTSTVIGDRVEADALREMFGDTPYISATKSSTGHMLAAAGSFEAVTCVKMLQEQRVPATINTETIDPDCDGINYLLGESIDAPLDFVLSNSFGFGDHNASLIFQRAE
jgi:3-oxoacyl-[acyl-carrier-protein] synthase II